MHPRAMLPLRVRLLVALLALALAPVGTLARQASPEATPAPRFTDTVDVGGGRRIGLTCQGDGNPTVLLVGGLTRPADVIWPEIVDAISPQTRVCVFERAALGPSDPQPSSPQTAEDVVADLRAALAAAGEAGPFVVVGFSVGGLFAQLYTRAYPDEVVGLVLVEGTPPGVIQRDFGLDWFLSDAEREGNREYAAGRDPSHAAPINFFLSEGQVVAIAPPPPDPAIVIVAGKVDPELPPAAQTTWYEGQAQQERDLHARVVYAEDSGHFVPLEQPEVVIMAIEDVVAAVRDPSSWATPAAATPAA